MTADTPLNTNGTDQKPPPRRFRCGSRLVCGVVLAAVLFAGAAAGAGVTRHIQHSYPQAVLLLQPKPIAQLANFTPVAIKGEVAETFGSKFIVQDESGRALVDTGPRGDKAPATKGETVTVQGHFANGIIHVDVIVHADGRSEGFGPPRPGHGPGHDPGDRHDEHGPGFGPNHGFGPDHGANHGPDRGPPPPPPAP